MKHVEIPKKKEKRRRKKQKRYGKKYHNYRSLQGVS